MKKIAATFERRLMTSELRDASGKFIAEDQLKYMKEECILVNREDRCIGKATKEECHKWENIETGGYLHRAFSVFLFNKKDELLLQKRSQIKVTFPGVWTNTCCSHPLYTEEELETGNDAVGVRRAARRKLHQELGFLHCQVPLESLQFITRILYKAKSSEEWGEHELDYILITKSDAAPLPNKNEVEAIRYVNMETLRSLIENFLFQWWKSLNDLIEKKNVNTIHDMTDAVR